MKKSTAISLRVAVAVCISVVLLAVLRQTNFLGIWQGPSDDQFEWTNRGQSISRQSISRHDQEESGDSIRVHVHNEKLRSTFTFTANFTFPHPWCTLKDVNEIVKTGWVKQLAAIMETWPDNQTVFMVTGDTKYESPLLNWLISAVLKANTPLSHILVVSLDENLHQLLQKRTICSVYVSPRSLFRNSSRFGSVMFTRLAIIRLLNHWGFTVAHFDSDALILRNPLPLFERYKSSSIVGQNVILSQARIRICMGAVMIRSNQQTGDYIAILNCLYCSALTEASTLMAMYM